jgi:hypothetical protein
MIRPGNPPKERIQHTEHGESLKSETNYLCDGFDGGIYKISQRDMVWWF